MGVAGLADDEGRGHGPRDDRTKLLRIAGALCSPGAALAASFHGTADRLLVICAGSFGGLGLPRGGGGCLRAGRSPFAGAVPPRGGADVPWSGACARALAPRGCSEAERRGEQIAQHGPARVTAIHAIHAPVVANPGRWSFQRPAYDCCRLPDQSALIQADRRGSRVPPVPRGKRGPNHAVGRDVTTYLLRPLQAELTGN